MALILIIIALGSLIYIGLRLFKSRRSRAVFISGLFGIIILPTYIMPDTSFGSSFSFVGNLALAEGNLAYVDFLHDEHSEVKSKEVKEDILGKIQFYQGTLESEISKINNLKSKLPVRSIYINKYTNLMNIASDNFKNEQYKLI